MKKDTTILILITLVLLLAGALMIFSIGALQDPRATVFLKHLLYLGVGIICFLRLMYFDYRKLGTPRMLRLIVVAAIFLLILTFIPPFGSTINGASRWIGWKFISFQPSEFAKFAMVLLLAVRLTQHQAKISNFGTGFVMPFFLAGIFVVIVLAQRDIGIPFVMLAATFAMVWVAGGRKLFLLGSAGFCAAGACGLVWMYPYRMDRIWALFDPWAYRETAGYHLIQSLYGFYQGGLWGRGPGAGEQKLDYLPAAHTDFIFSSLGEEFGLVGTIITVLLFLGMLYVALRISAKAPDLFGTLLATGITMLLTVQAAFIMCVNVGLAPTKGLPLPFVSYGGSALIVSLAMMGILVNIGIQGELERAEQPVGISLKIKRSAPAPIRPRLASPARAKS